jgi:RNA polymerase sigma factor (sigma-70 family)
MDDSEIIATVAAGDPAGLAGAYDKYAPALYGYCRWVLGEHSYAADALLETFSAAAAELTGVKDASKTRAWLYAVAKAKCDHRVRTAGASFDEMAEQTRPPADAAHLGEQDELRRLIRATLAELQPKEHEILELSIRHGLYEAELAAVLGMSRYQAQALASRARDHLAKILDGLLIARTRRWSCPELGNLLADWDGRLTVQTGKVAVEHIDHCERCTPLRHGPLRPEVLSSLLPLAPLPTELREPTLGCAAAITTPASRGGMTWRTGPAGLAGFRRLGQLPAWSRIRANPGATMAAAAVAVWVVAAISVTLITLTGMHTARAPTSQTHARTPAATTPAPSSTASSSTKASPPRSPGPASRLAPPTTTSPLPTKSVKPTPSHSAKPSASASLSPLASSPPMLRHRRTLSPTPTPTSSSPSPSPSPTLT